MQSRSFHRIKSFPELIHRARARGPDLGCQFLEALTRQNLELTDPFVTAKALEKLIGPMLDQASQVKFVAVSNHCSPHPDPGRVSLQGFMCPGPGLGFKSTPYMLTITPGCPA